MKIVGTNIFLRIVDSHPRLYDQANIIKKASERAIRIIENRRSPPKRYLREVLQATIAFTTKIIENLGHREILNTVVKLSADSYN